MTTAMDDVNSMLERLRNKIADAEADVADKKESRRIAKEKKDIAESEYEYYSKRVTAAQERVTRLRKNMKDILTETGV